jgi:mannose-6-phosphate isomerase-like protein (cupin superfamily)
MKLYSAEKDQTGKEVRKPWGSYKVIEHKKNCLVKQINVLLRALLSLQSHTHRSEYWTAVSGVAHVQREDDILTLEKD